MCVCVCVCSEKLKVTATTHVHQTLRFLAFETYNDIGLRTRDCLTPFKSYIYALHIYFCLLFEYEFGKLCFLDMHIRGGRKKS